MADKAPGDRVEGAKLQMSAALAEYDMARRASFGFREMVGQLDRLALTALGLSIPLILAILEREAHSIGATLLLPILFFALAFVQMRHERQATLDSTYVHSRLRPKMNGLIAEVSGEKASVLGYEPYLAEHYFPRSFFAQWVVTVSRAGISIGAGLVLILVCLYLQFVVIGARWAPYETLLLIVDAILLAADLAFAHTTARIFWQFYTKQVRRDG